MESNIRGLRCDRCWCSVEALYVGRFGGWVCCFCWAWQDRRGLAGVGRGRFATLMGPWELLIITVPIWLILSAFVIRRAGWALGIVVALTLTPPAAVVVTLLTVSLVGASLNAARVIFA
jgi:hypothetical protein